MNIVPAISSEADTLTAIALLAKSHWRYPAHWIAQWKPSLAITPEFLAAHETYTARDGQHISGFCSLCRQGDVLRLEHLWVVPSAMGGGIGRALFRFAQRRAWELGFEFMELVADPNAAGFYEHMGAERIGADLSWIEGQRRELPIFRCRTSDNERPHQLSTA